MRTKGGQQAQNHNLKRVSCPSFIDKKEQSIEDLQTCTLYITICPKPEWSGMGVIIKRQYGTSCPSNSFWHGFLTDLKPKIYLQNHFKTKTEREGKQLGELKQQYWLNDWIIDFIFYFNIGTDVDDSSTTPNLLNRWKANIVWSNAIVSNAPSIKYKSDDKFVTQMHLVNKTMIEPQMQLRPK